MTEFSIIEAKKYHCGEMARKLRHAHKEAIVKLGINTHRELLSRFNDSSFRRAWLINGKLAALGGVTGPLLAGYGYIWVAFTADALRYPLEIIKEARRQLDEIMLTKTELMTTIIGGDEAARRFAVFLGFHADHAEGSPATSIFGRRRLNDFLIQEEKFRIPITSGYIIPLGYHPNEE